MKIRVTLRIEIGGKATEKSAEVEVEDKPAWVNIETPTSESARIISAARALFDSFTSA